MDLELLQAHAASVWHSQQSEGYETSTTHLKVGGSQSWIDHVAGGMLAGGV